MDDHSCAESLFIGRFANGYPFARKILILHLPIVVDIAQDSTLQSQEFKMAPRSKTKKSPSAATNTGSTKRTRKPPREARWHGLNDTPSTESISLPSGKRHGILPLVEVGSKDFEFLCRDVIREVFPDVTRVAMKRRHGQRQYGADVEGFDKLNKPSVVVSCKCYHEVDAWEVKAWINDFRKYLNTHWLGKNVKHFVLAVTVESNDDDINNAVAEITEELAAVGVQFHIWDTYELTDFLKRDRALIDRYFNESWVTAIAGHLPVVPMQTAFGPFAVRDPVAHGATYAQVEAAYLPPLNNLTSQSLEHALKELRGGRRAAIEQWLANTMGEDKVWAGTSNEVRAKGLRAAAMVALANRDLAGSSEFLDNADLLFPAPDRSARALLLRASDGLSKAMDFLVDPVDRKERETMAAFLIEDGEPKNALDVLSSLVGDEASSDVLRLRAIAKVLSRAPINEALSLANSAVTKEPGSAKALLTLGQIKLASALAFGIDPQLGSIPNPISRTFVRATADARSQLKSASQDFERLKLMVEGDFKRDVEIWLMAALLLNPDTFAKGRALARAMLAREVLEPAVVVWCLQHGISVRKGRIRKQLGDAIRGGVGTPGHVAVLALMSSSDNPAKGLAVIDSFGSMFPEATDFFEYWRAQFLRNSDDGRSFIGAVNAAKSSGDHASIISFLNSDDATVENLLAGCEALSSNGAFQDVNSFRDRLVATGTARGVELAASAALKTDDARGSHQILELAIADGLDETPRLQRLKVSTDETLAKHEDLIRKLERDLAGKDDDYLRDRLVNAYLRIGDLDKIKVHTELAINKGAIPAASAVRLAYVLRTHSPETARRALEAVHADEITSELASTILTVSSHLGLQDLQQEMMRRLIGQSDENHNIQRIEKVEDVIAMIEERAANLRQRVDDWIHGRSLMVTALGSDLKSQVLLYLSSEELRINGVSGAIPRMLRSGIQARPTSPLPKERPTLKLDFSALLLADRFHLLDALEASFDIRIPESLPEALIEATGTLSELPQTASTAIRSVDGVGSAVTILEQGDPSEYEFISLTDDVSEDKKAYLAYAVDQAFLGGHLTGSMVQELRTQFAISDSDRRERVQKLILSGRALSELARIDLLAPLSRGFPIEIRRTEIQWLLSLIDRFEDEDRVRRQVIALRALVASKLSSSTWNTILTPRSYAEIAHPERLPAPMRCVLETLPTGDEIETEFFWIEDRTLSKQPLPGGLDLPAVIAHLKANGSIDSDRAAVAAAELRRMGYLFIPIDTDEILDVIRRAATVDEELVENQEIVEIRRWFARDVLHLRYVDQSHQINSDGKIVGESRCLLDLSNLATDLIEEVWKSDNGTSFAEMRARSNWIWAMLRLDALPSPPAIESDEARRGTASIAVMHLLTIPIFADLKNTSIPERNLQPFVDWAMQNVMDPFRLAAPEGVDDVLEMIAAMLETQLKNMRDDNPVVDSFLRSRTLSAIGNYMDRLPHEIGDGITSKRDLRKKLYRENVMVFDLDDDHRVVTRDVSKAWVHIRESGDRSAEIKLHADGKTGTLEVEDLNGPPEVWIKAGNLKWNLHPTTVALVAPDQEERQRLLLALPRDGNVGSPLSDEFLSDIAAEQDTDKRVDRFHRYISADFASSRMEIRSRISAGNSIQLSHLALPSPESVLNFHGLPGDFRGSGEELLRASLAILKDKVGLEETVERLCGLPIRLPKELLCEYAEIPTVTAEFERDFQSFPLSFTRVLGIVLGGNEVPKAAAQMLSKERAHLFLAVLRHGAKQALRTKEWKDIPDELSLCLIWIHANELTKSLSVSGLDLAKLTTWLSDRTFTRTLDREIERARPDWVIEYSQGMSETYLIGAAIAELLRNGCALEDDLKAMFGHQGSSAWMISPDLMVPRPTPPVEYWVGAETLDVFTQVGLVPEDHPFIERDPSALLLRIMDEVGATPSILIPMVATLIDVKKVDIEILDALRKLIDALDTAQGVARLDPEYVALVDLISRVYRRQDDVDGFTNWLRRSAAENSRQWPLARVGIDDERDANKAFETLLNVCFTFAWAGGNTLADRAAVVAELLVTLADAWPATHKIVLRCIDLLSREVDPVTAARSLLPSMLELKLR